MKDAEELTNCTSKFNGILDQNDTSGICQSIVPSGAKEFRKCAKSYGITLEKAEQVVIISEKDVKTIIAEYVDIISPKEQPTYHSLLEDLKEIQKGLVNLILGIETHNLTAQDVSAKIGKQYLLEIETKLQEIIALADDEHAKTVRNTIQNFLMRTSNAYHHLISAFVDVAAYVDTNKVIKEDFFIL